MRGASALISNAILILSAETLEKSEFSLCPIPALFINKLIP